MPIFTASTPMSSTTARTCSTMNSAGTVWIAGHADGVLRGQRGDRGHPVDAAAGERLQVGLDAGAAAGVGAGDREDGGDAHVVEGTNEGQQRLGRVPGSDRFVPLESLAGLRGTKHAQEHVRSPGRSPGPKGTKRSFSPGGTDPASLPSRRCRSAQAPRPRTPAAPARAARARRACGMPAGPPPSCARARRRSRARARPARAARRWAGSSWRERCLGHARRVGAEQEVEDVAGVADRAPRRRGAARWCPRTARLVTGPGTAATVRPRSAARSAVMSDPERSVASTTIVSVDERGDDAGCGPTKHQRWPPKPGGISDTTAPCAIRPRVQAAHARAGTGRRRHRPGRRPAAPGVASSAPRCAAESIAERQPGHDAARRRRSGRGRARARPRARTASRAARRRSRPRRRAASAAERAGDVQHRRRVGAARAAASG